MDVSNSLQIEGLNANELRPTPNWSQEQIDFIVNRRFEMSAADLAKELGKTKGAVVGKLFRIGLKVPPSFTKKMVSRGVKRMHKAGKYANRARIVKVEGKDGWNPIKTSYKRGTKAVAQHMIEPPVGILNGVGVKLWELESHHCKWVVGEPSNLTCCGQNRQKDSPYCQEHHQVAYKGKPNGR